MVLLCSLKATDSIVSMNFCLVLLTYVLVIETALET